MHTVSNFSFATQPSPADWRTLLEVARHSIKYGITYKKSPYLELDKYSDSIKTKSASFVTIRESSVLRGCIGSVQAHCSLVQDVANHAFAAAFQDKRFPSINHIEEPVVHISIALVSQCNRFSFTSESDLISQIEVLKCGLVLHYKKGHATLLPDSWNQVKNGREFLKELKKKLKLSAEFWSSEIIVEGYDVLTVD